MQKGLLLILNGKRTENLHSFFHCSTKKIFYDSHIYNKITINNFFLLLTFIFSKTKLIAMSKILFPFLQHKRKAYILVFSFFLSSLSFAQQKITVTGNVVTEKNIPLVGMSVNEKGNTSGTTTDADGKFTIQTAGNARLVFSFVGYTTQEVPVNNRKKIEVVMEVNVSSLDQVVVVGYGTQKKNNLTGSVASVNSEQLTIAPIANVTNALAGKLPGLIAKQTSGQPGADAAMLSIRGFGAPLVIVDGVEAILDHLDASQIESISVLKDGAASIYGARAGNGVILVTTKRGKNQEPTMSLNSSFTMQGSTKINTPDNSGQRAEWDREEYLNAGNPPSQVPYTEEDIKKYLDGTDSNYLNSDWFGAVLRPWAPQQNHNLSVRGGNEKIKYYGLFSYLNQETIINKNGGNYSRYNVQSNIDAKVTKSLTLSLDLSIADENRFFPVIGLYNGSNLWPALYESQPRLRITLPDPMKLGYGGIPYGNALYATSTELSGYNNNKNKQLRMGASLTYDFKKIKGLKAKAFVNSNNYIGNSKSFQKQRDFYQYNNQSQQYTYIRSSQDPTALSESMSSSNNLTQQYSFSYENTFNKIHRISALALYELNNYKDNGFNTSRSGFMSIALDQLFAGNPTTAANGGSASEMGRVSYVGRINYSLMDRFLLETIFRADASSKFPINSRWGYFPSVSLGWVLSREKFIKSLGFVDNLKLRASYGQSGNDAVGNYQYLSGYAFDGSYILGNQIRPGLYSTGLANPILTWEQMTIHNLGVDFSFLNRKIYGTGEAFYRLREGIPGTRVTSLPSTFGAALPLENLNSIDTRGFEFTLGTSGKRGDFSYDLSGNISWVRSKWVKFDEPKYTDKDQKRLYQRSGQWTDLQVGYVSDKLFTSQDKISALPYTYKDLNGNSTLRPGDLRYSDINQDGVLDWKDQKVIGTGSIPHWMYGLNAILRYKNFDLFAFFQGSFGYATYVYMEGAKTALRFENRWEEGTNNPNALVPRPGGAPTNGYYSDYRMHPTSYVRLKNASLGYELHHKLLNKAGISQLRIYVAGTNIFTFSSIKKYGVDPEVSDGNGPTGIAVNTVYYYPQQRTVSLGVNLKF